MKTITVSGSSQELSIPPASFIWYRGFSLRETVGADAVVRVWDNASAASGPLLDTVSLAPKESARECYDPAKAATAGIYIEIVSGTVEGSISYE